MIMPRIWKQDYVNTLNLFLWNNLIWYIMYSIWVFFLYVTTRCAKIFHSRELSNQKNVKMKMENLEVQRVPKVREASLLFHWTWPIHGYQGFVQAEIVVLTQIKNEERCHQLLNYETSMSVATCQIFCTNIRTKIHELSWALWCDSFF